MPNATPRYAWPYATLQDPPNGPADEGGLALAIETTVGAVQDSANAQRLWRHVRTTSATETTATTAATAQPVMRIDNIPIINGHLYQVRADFGYYSLNSGRIKSRLTVRTGGTAAVVTDTSIREVQHATVATSIVIDGLIVGLYTATATTTLSVLFSHYIVSGAGNAGRYADATWPMLFSVEDKGVDPGATGVSL